MLLYKEMGIDDDINAANAELQRLRIATMGYTHVNAEGSVIVDSCPELDALQAKITAIEAQLQTVTGIKDQVAALLGGYDSIQSMRIAKQKHANTVQGNPVRAWDLFRMKKELAIEKGNAIVRMAMPSELPDLLDGYQAEEDALKAGLVASLAAIATITQSLDSIADLTNQARATLSA